ncbi:MAG: hypothetical protein NTX82_00520 [Candidatus Parcubacteria bacterium]|nr:hypothetical protein [Candidatus Parcubacteria bacterium]
MSRLEKESDDNGQMGEMQKEIERLKKDLKHKQSRKIFNCGTCLILALLFILILSGFFAYVLAKSGLRQIPVLTAYFYHQPSPAYVVISSDVKENIIVNRLTSLVSAEAIKQKKTENISVGFDLSEKEITGLLNNQLGKNEKLKAEIEMWQIAVLPESLEFFMKGNKPKNLIITLNATPEVKDGKLKFKVNNFKVGDLQLPKFFGSVLIENIGSSVVNGLLSSVSALGQIQEFNLAQGKVTIKLLINNLITLKNAI